MPTRSHPEERAVASAWEQQDFDLYCLASLGLQVIFRGMPSDAGGPDYQDAILSSGGTSLLRGDIEFHVRSSDWYRHGHHRDRAYNRVILHVVWEQDDSATERANGTLIPVCALAANQPVMRLQLFSAPCVASFLRLNAGSLEDQITSLGLTRFQQRRDRFAGELEADEADQILYRNLLESLGYASNRQAFRHLSDVAPYRWLMSVPPNLRLPTLVAAAGFEAQSPVELPARLSPAVWRLSRLRPANHPLRRLAGITDVLERLRPSLPEALAQAVLAAQRPADLRKCLIARGEEGSWIGVGRADEMAASVVLPFVAAYDRAAGAAELFARYPSPPHTRWTRSMLETVTQAGHKLAVRTAPIHQGLHFLYHEFCRPERTTTCAICTSTAVAQSV